MNSLKGTYVAVPFKGKCDKEHFWSDYHSVEKKASKLVTHPA